MRTITITAYQRPAYFERLLSSLTENDLTGWEIWIFLEPSSSVDSFRRQCEQQLGGMTWHLIVNQKRLGVSQNPYQALSRVFSEGSEYNLYLEEDLELSPDTTALAAWYAQHVRSDEICMNLLAGGCFSRGILSHPDHPNQLVSAPMFNSLGMVLTKQQWQTHFEPHWFDFPFGLSAPNGLQMFGWDCAIYAYLLANPSLNTLQPLCARSRHLGKHGGEYCDEDFQDDVFTDQPIHTEPTPTAGYARVTELRDLPHALRTHLYLWQEQSRTLDELRRKNRTLRWLKEPLYRWWYSDLLLRWRKRRWKQRIESAKRLNGSPDPKFGKSKPSG